MKFAVSFVTNREWFFSIGYVSIQKANNIVAIVCQCLHPPFQMKDNSCWVRLKYLFKKKENLKLNWKCRCSCLNTNPVWTQDNGGDSRRCPVYLTNINMRPFSCPKLLRIGQSTWSVRWRASPNRFRWCRTIRQPSNRMWHLRMAFAFDSDQTDPNHRHAWQKSNPRILMPVGRESLRLIWFSANNSPEFAELLLSCGWCSLRAMSWADGFCCV